MAIITPSDVIAGVHIVEPAMHGDERGFFIETYRRVGETPFKNALFGEKQNAAA